MTTKRTTTTMNTTNTGKAMRTLFLNPPSFDGFDGGAGSRYQARREVRSFWYPTWLAQLAALVPDSRLVDAPARGLSADDVVAMAPDYELAVVYTSTPSFGNDARLAEALKAANPDLTIGFIGPHVMVLPEESLLACPAIDFVTGAEFDYTIKEVAEGRPLREVAGLSFREGGRDGGKVVRTPDRGPVEDMDALPHVADVYKRDLVIEDYFIGYLLHPYVSIYSGRGCTSRCTYCLWPQTIGGRRFRTRSPENVAREVEKIVRLFPQVKEIFFDTDTFTGDRPHAEAVARLIGPVLGRAGVAWSCTARPNVPRETLKVMRDNGLRLLIVGYESGVQEILNNIKKGIAVEGARTFTRHCHDLGILIHGTFMLGLPGETRETIERTLAFAKEMNPRTIQVSLPAAYPGTELHRQAVASGWLRDESGKALVDGGGTQVCSLSYPHLSHEDISAAVESFYKRFFFRPGKILEMLGEMVRSPEMMRRRLREGVEFFQFLARRKGPSGRSGRSGRTGREESS
jgi:hopanoid biosynthesis associated radical SAM protein HpnJ